MIEAPVLFEEIDGGGWITLNRPHALNALNLDMVDAIAERLRAWESSERVAYVVIQGLGRSFCAGGDLRHLYHAHLQGSTKEAFQFFSHEYRLNLMIHNYSKPYLALLHGITMGGGMGLSIHGTYRVVTENTVMAMPETSIGLFPDVGAAWFLNRCPGKSGLFVALTSYRMNHLDALYMGLGTHYVESHRLDDLISQIKGSQGIGLDGLLGSYVLDHKNSYIQEHQDQIDRLFSQQSLGELFCALESSRMVFAQETLAMLQKRSPHSLRQTFDYLKLAETMSIEEVIARDEELASTWDKVDDFWEGIRAAVIDKDQAPRWSGEPIVY